MKIDFIKGHGTGNDFVIVDEISKDYNLSEENRVKLAISICNRESSIGADGLVFVQKSDKYDGKMRIFNADGTEPEMCGNALRCVSRILLKKLNKKTAIVETMKAVYSVKEVEEVYPGVYTDEICIDSVSFEISSLPVKYESNNLLFGKLPTLSVDREFSAVSITNPHLVVFVDEINVAEVEEVGKKANSDKEVLPKGVNVNFVKIIDEDSIYVKTYERGVGLTKSCGTGMVSASIITAKKIMVQKEKELKIYNDGGMIKCTVVIDEAGKYKVYMKGNATFVFKGAIEIDDKFQVTELLREYFDDENNAYDNFLNYVNSVI